MTQKFLADLFRYSSGWRYKSLPLLPPPPIPIYGVAKVSCQGGEHIKRNICSMISMLFTNKINKMIINHLGTNKCHIFGDGWMKYWSLFPPSPNPIPIPSVAKLSCQGVAQVEKNTCLMIFHALIKNKQGNIDK